MSRSTTRDRSGGDRTNFYDDITNKIIAELEKGRFPWVQPWDAPSARAQLAMPKNASTMPNLLRKEYAMGKDPIAIVADLNRDGIPSPRGGCWNASALLGSPRRRNGVLNNELYRGTIVYNRQHFVKDPATGRRVAQENPESEWLRQAVPELRIVDDETWGRVQARRGSRAGPKLHHRRRPKRLLSGLLRCACCGGIYTVVQDERRRCSTLQNSRRCTNTRTIKTSEVEQRVLVALRKHLLAPDVVAVAVEAYRKER
jgi:hypothetical protein